MFAHIPAAAHFDVQAPYTLKALNLRCPDEPSGWFNII